MLSSITGFQCNLRLWFHICKTGMHLSHHFDCKFFEILSSTRHISSSFLKLFAALQVNKSDSSGMPQTSWNRLFFSLFFFFCQKLEKALQLSSCVAAEASYSKIFQTPWFRGTSPLPFSVSIENRRCVLKSFVICFVFWGWPWGPGFR